MDMTDLEKVPVLFWCHLQRDLVPNNMQKCNQVTSNLHYKIKLKILTKIAL